MGPQYATGLSVPTAPSEALQLTATIKEELMLLRDKLNPVISVPKAMEETAEKAQEIPSPLITELQDIIRQIKFLRTDVRL